MKILTYLLTTFLAMASHSAHAAEGGFINVETDLFEGLFGYTVIVGTGLANVASDFEDLRQAAEATSSFRDARFLPTLSISRSENTTTISLQHYKYRDIAASTFNSKENSFLVQVNGATAKQIFGALNGPRWAIETPWPGFEKKSRNGTIRCNTLFDFGDDGYLCFLEFKAD